MQVRDEFAQDHPLPVFLTGDSQRFEDEHGSSLLIKMSLLFVATIAIGVGMILALGLPKSLFADATPTDPPAAARLITDQSTPPDQPASPSQSASQPTTPATADTGPTFSTGPTLASAPAASETTATTPDSASDSQAAAPASADLLKQFQSWAATQDAQQPAAPAPSAPAQVEAIRPIQQNESVRPIQDATQQANPAQDAPTTQIIQDNPTPARAAHKHHKPPPAQQNARAEIGTPKVVHPTRPDRNARADARAPQPQQEQPPQPTQPPSLLQSLGLSRQ